MTRPPTRPIDEIDAALDDIQQTRERLLAQPAGAERSLQLAELADAEALWWEALSERAGTRVHWRAALSAREYAQATARHHRRQAAPPQPAPLTTTAATAGAAA